MKALWVQNKKPFGWVHKTAELFDGLPLIQQKRLQADAEDELAKLNEFTQLADGMERSVGRSLPPGISDRLRRRYSFRERLTRSSNAFVEWRYYFELTEMDLADPNFMDRLARVALQLLHELRCQ